MTGCSELGKYCNSNKCSIVTLHISQMSDQYCHIQSLSGWAVLTRNMKVLTSVQCRVQCTAPISAGHWNLERCRCCCSCWPFLFSRPSLWWLFHLTEGVKFWHLERKFCSLLLNFENLTVIHISDCNETKMLSTIFILHFTADIFYWLEILTYWNKREKLPK